MSQRSSKAKGQPQEESQGPRTPEGAGRDDRRGSAAPGGGARTSRPSPAPPPRDFTRSKFPLRVVLIVIDGVKYLADPALCLKPAGLEDGGRVPFCGMTMNHAGRCEPWLRLRRMR